MALLSEMDNPQSPMNAELQAGLAVLSGSETVTFTQFVRQVLPLDGFVFWVRSDLLTPSAVTAAGVTVAAPVEIAGSLHVTSNVVQEAAEHFARKEAIFTTAAEVNELSADSPNELWIAYGPGNTPYAFSAHAPFYQMAGLWHYTGEMLHPSARNFIVDSADQLDLTNVIASNSLPFWLSFGVQSTQPWYAPRMAFPLYPDKLVPLNAPEPYGVVEIPSTTPLTAAPYISSTSSHLQLAHDHVKITLYGVRNGPAQDFVDAVFTFSQTAFPQAMGIMTDRPVVQDISEGQREFGIRAARKLVEFDVSYYQSRVNDFAQQLITDAVIGVTPNL